MAFGCVPLTEQKFWMDVCGLGHVYQQRITDLDVQFVSECLINDNRVEGLFRCFVEIRRGLLLPKP